MRNFLNNISFYENLLEKKMEDICVMKESIKLKNLCRACLCETSDSNSLSKQCTIGVTNINLPGKVLQISYMLKELTGLQIKEHDALSYKLCNNCMQNVYNTYCFRVQCRRAEKTLVKLVELLSDNEDPNDVNKVISDNEDHNNEEIYEDVQHLESISSKGKFVILSTKNDDDDENMDKNCEECELMEINLLGNANISDNEDIEEKHEEQEEEEEESFQLNVEYIEQLDDIYQDGNDNEITNDVIIECNNSDATNTLSVPSPSSLPAERRETITKSNKNDDTLQLIEKIPNNKKSIKKKDLVKVAHLCVECNEKFPFKKNLREHMRKNHPNLKAFKCNVCQSKFINSQTLKRHMKIHQDDQKTKLCTFCGKRFTRADDLTRHVRTHTNERPYKCQLCLKSYKQPSELNEHLKTHSRTKVFQCEKCSKCLSTRNGFYVHMKVHAGDKKHKCNYCNKQFVTSGELTSHIRHIHQNNPVYKCKFNNCKKKFPTKLSYNAHQRSHTVEQLSKCTSCNKIFALDHSKNRIDQNHYPCRICNKLFKTLTSYKKHLQYHGVDSISNDDVLITNDQTDKCDSCCKKFYLYHGIPEETKIANNTENVKMTDYQNDQDYQSRSVSNKSGESTEICNEIKKEIETEIKNEVQNEIQNENYNEDDYIYQLIEEIVEKQDEDSIIICNNINTVLQEFIV